MDALFCGSDAKAQAPALFPILLGGMLAEDRARTIRKGGQCFAVVAIPWEMISPCGARAARNHGQDLETLARRGGLSACETLAVLEDRKWRKMHWADANKLLGEKCLQFCGAGILT